MPRSAFHANAILCAIAGSLCSAASLLGAESVCESPRQIPVAYDVDVVVVGGSSGAVEAACEAARHGVKVFLLADRPYLGTDLCATLRLWLEEGEAPKSPLALACFGKQRLATPWAIKAAMDRALLQAGVAYLTGCYVTDILTDKEGRLAGVVMANRSGRQAVRAKVIVDATDRAVAARQAQAAFRPFVPGRQTFGRVVIGGTAQTGEHVSVRKTEFTCKFVVDKTPRLAPVYAYTLEIDVPGNDAASFYEVEQRARDMTCGREAEATADDLSYVPSDTIVGEDRLETWPGVGQASLGAFRPKGVPRLYVLGAYSDLSRPARQALLRPLELMAMGTRIGRAAADEAQALGSPEGVSPAATPTKGDDAGRVAEDLGGIRSVPGQGTIDSGRRAVPVLGHYDVVVVGGGTSGAPAGIAAAKRGAKTLVIEYLHELGGVGTAGLIASYWYGVRTGYTAYVDQHVNPGQSKWNVLEKAEWLRQELRRNGAQVWFGTLACGALVQNGKVCGVVVATPQGRGVVLATTVVDATGNSNVAAWAQAPTRYSVSDRGSLNVQIAGFPPRPLHKFVVNTCYTMVDDTDVLDVWHLMAWRRTAGQQGSSFDVGQLIDSRERRRMVGEYTLTVEDILSGRTFPDTISQHYSNFDAGAFPDARLLLIADAKGPCFHADLPYRCLLPKGLDGVLVVGLGASADRDAMTLVRMQADLQNQGYAAGAAAAAAVKRQGHTRAIDLKALQRELVGEGVLEERVLTDRDSFPKGPQEIDEAVQSLGDSDQQKSLTALAILSAHSQQATPVLEKRYRDLPAGEEQLRIAKILGFFGNATGEASLMAAIDAQSGWDEGMALTSQRKTGNLFSELDRLVMALGFSGAPQGTPTLLRKLEQLTPESPMSHYKAISLALWNTPSPNAVEPLAGLLGRPGFGGHATFRPVLTSVGAEGRPEGKTADRLTTADADAPANRGNLNLAMKELLVAALLYRCGDREGRGKAVLQQYAGDLHGHFARYAQAVLEGRLSDAPR